ncbi:hypothetical protein M8998_11900 [Sphingobacterium sp. lm-10]|uniref:hypothetical protein n=1 Tax=Sphingobacterium sp. lm-10 TaxID=2944904 RepID=UPI00202127C8|nr:hypothetical protein [Sphingobacterium sp. lm-10]MCL7988641.1 hypothetical protein [Sphingobacterium sp. lm-10]
MKKLATYIIALILLGAVGSCENPLKDFDLQISTEVIKNYATLRIVDPNGNTINGVAVALVSGDTEDIYNMNGFRDFRPTENLVTFGLDPKRMPTAAAPVRFRVSISASGYTTQIVPVSITEASAGIETIILRRPTQLPDGVSQVRQNIALGANGATLEAITISLAAAEGGGQVSLDIPAGTQFLDATDNVIVGRNLEVMLGSINGRNPQAQSFLPGGSLRSDNVVLAGGSTSAGAFSPGAIAQINMVINGIQVRRFSQALSLGLPVRSDYVSPLSGRTISAAESFEVFTNSSSDRVWRFEQNTSITGDASSGYRVTFPITHLTFFLAGEFAGACNVQSVINFTGDWMANGSTYPVTVEAVSGGNVIFSGQYSISANMASISIANLPVSGVSIVVRNSAGNILAEGPLAACGQTTQIALPNPGNPTNPTATLQLYVRCPDKVDPITLLPTFQLYYRETGTRDFQFLGTVTNGFLRTTLLRTDGTRYDFRAIWNNRVKVVGGHTIQEDNTATVGIQPGDIIGTKAGATNLAILTEECGKL